MRRRLRQVGLALSCVSWIAACSSSSTPTAGPTYTTAPTPRPAGIYPPSIRGDVATDAEPGPALPGTDLFAASPSEDVAAFIADGQALYALLVTSDSSCAARWMKFGTSSAPAAPAMLWSGTACAANAADGGDVLVWTDSSNGETTIHSVPKAGGADSAIATVAYLVSSIAADASGYYWTYTGATDQNQYDQPCIGGLVATLPRSDASVPTTIESQDSCPDAIYVDAGTIYWIAQQIAAPDSNAPFWTTKAILYRSLAGGNVSTVATVPYSGQERWAYESGYAYQVDDFNTTVTRTSLADGGAPSVVVQAPAAWDASTSAPVVVAMAVHADTVAWTQYPYAADFPTEYYTILVQKPGGQPTPLGDWVNPPAYVLGLDSSSVYFETIDHHIVAIAVP